MTKITKEEFEILQTKLKDEEQKTEAFQAAQSELEDIFLTGISDDVKELIPEGLNLKAKIKFTQQLNKKFDKLKQDFGKNLNNDEINNPGNNQPGKKSGNNKDFKGLSGKELLFAGLNFKNYK